MESMSACEFMDFVGTDSLSEIHEFVTYLVLIGYGIESCISRWNYGV